MVEKNFGWKKFVLKNFGTPKILVLKTFVAQNNFSQKELGESLSNKHDTVAGGSVHTNAFAGKGWNGGINGFFILFLFVIPFQMCPFAFLIVKTPT